MIKQYILFVFFILFISCNNEKQITGKYETEYRIHYCDGTSQTITIYTNKEVYACSFQGTNFLLEKDNNEEILSTTAQIEIIKSNIIK